MNRILLVLTLLLSACGTLSTAKVDIHPEEHVAFNFSDIRPDDIRQSSSSSGANGKITVLGDSSISPSPAELVKTTLQTNLGSKLAGKTVQFVFFRCEIREPGGKVDYDRLGATAFMPGVGPLAALLAAPVISAIEDARASKHVVITTTITIDGTQYSDVFNKEFSGRVTESNLNESLKEALSQFANQVLNTKS